MKYNHRFSLLDSMQFIFSSFPSFSLNLYTHVCYLYRYKHVRVYIQLQFLILYFLVFKKLLYPQIKVHMWKLSVASKKNIFKVWLENTDLENPGCDVFPNATFTMKFSILLPTPPAYRNILTARRFSAETWELLLYSILLCVTVPGTWLPCSAFGLNKWKNQ